MTVKSNGIEGVLVMPSALLHKEQYRHNKEFLKSCEASCTGADCDDWLVTILFYCSVHLIEGKLAEKNKHCDHVKRDTEMKNSPDLFSSALTLAYKELYSLSIKARYNCVKMNRCDKQVASDNLQEIETLYNE